MREQLLQEIIFLQEYEAPHTRDVNALLYMAQWDYGEYHTDPIPRSTLHSTAGRSCENNAYLLLWYPDGSMVLYRKLLPRKNR